MSVPPRTAPFRAARAYLNQRPVPVALAILSSLASSLCAVALLPLGYLAIDLLDTRGRVAAYTDLPASRQAAFRDEWATAAGQRPGVVERLAQFKIAPLSDKPTAAEWEVRHALVVHDDLARLVGPAAAEAYSPSEPVGTADELGVLATVARERQNVGGRVLAWLASWNPWSWHPSGPFTANAAYLTGLLVLALALVALRGLFLNLHDSCSTAAVLTAGTRLRRAIYTHAQRLTAVAVRADEQAHVGALVAEKVDRVQDGLTASLAGAVRGPVFVGTLLVLMLLGHVWLSVALVAAAATVWLVAGQAAAFFRREARLSDRRAESRLAVMRESFATMTLSKAYLMERFSQTRFERQLADLGRSVARRQRGETFSRPTLTTVVTLAAVLVAYLAARVALSGEMTLAGFFFKLGTLAVLVYAVTRWTAALARVRAGGHAAAEVFEFLDRRADVRAVDNPIDPLTGRPELSEARLYEWLDRPLEAEASPEIVATFADLRRVRATVVRLQGSLRLSGTDPVLLEEILAEVAHRVAGRVASAGRSATPLPLAFLDAAVWAIRMPPGLDDEARGRLNRSAVERYYEAAWLARPRQGLGGLSPVEAGRLAGAGDPVARIRLEGVVRLREQLGERPTTAALYQGYPFDRLRRRLGLAPTDPDAVDPLDAASMSGPELDALDPETLDDYTLADAYESATALGDDTRTARFAAPLSARDPASLGRLDRRALFATLVRSELANGSIEGAMARLDRAQAVDLALHSGRDRATYETWRAEVYVRVGRAAEAVAAYRGLAEGSPGSAIALDAAETLLDAGFEAEGQMLAREALDRAEALGDDTAVERLKAILLGEL